MPDQTGAFMSDPSEAAGRKRNSCKAIVVRDERVLFTVNRDGQGDFLLLPGGGQRFGETLVDAMIRETLEETGWRVEPLELVLVREYIGRNHEFAEQEGDVHQTEFFFLAFPLDEHPSEPLEKDAWQTGIAWLKPADLPGFRIYPSVLRSILGTLISGSYSGPLYLGDTN